MALSTSTGSLAVGASRTFNLSPGSALTLVAPPNVRATVTETPNTVSASGVGGNASRVHNLQLGQTVTYGPYPMGGTVVVANASNSGGAVTWVRSDALVAESASGVVSLVSGDRNLSVLGLSTPPADSVLSKYGRQADDICAANVTVGVTTMAHSLSNEKSRFSTYTRKATPSASKSYGKLIHRRPNPAWWCTPLAGPCKTTRLAAAFMAAARCSSIVFGLW